MPIRTSIGKVLVNNVLPPEYRDYTRPLVGKDIDAIMTDIAKNHPEKYKDVSYKLMRVGAKAIQHLAPTVTLNDLEMPAPVRKRLIQAAKKQTDQIFNSDLTPKEKKEAIAEIYTRYQKAIVNNTFDNALKRKGAYAKYIQAGARGNKIQLAAMLSTPAFYNDAQDNPVPLFIEHSYAEGLTPAEFFVSAYGTRKGVKSTKFETRRGGDFGKQLMTAAGDLVVTKHDCGDQDGIEVDALDDDNIGALLARPVAGYNAGEAVTKEVMAKLRKNKVKTIMIRSPETCKTRKGVCAKCAGLRENNKLPEIGYALGLVAGTGLTERVAQGALNCIATTELVRMADGTTKAIGEIRPGDMVMGVTSDGTITPTKVLNYFDNGVMDVYRTVFDRNIVTESTLDHKYFGPEGLEPIGELTAVNVITGLGTGKRDKYSQELLGKLPVCDIEVELDSHMFLLANGLVCSNSKHTAGQKLTGDARYTGFDYINRFFQVPQHYPHEMAIAETDGTVQAITKAPQGGSYITIGGKQHYVEPDREIRVKRGQRLEAGDPLTDGVMNPAKVVKYKGIGETRRMFTGYLHNMLKNSGIKYNRRNVETLSRAVVNNVKVTDPEGVSDFLPDDIADYNALAFNYVPRKDAKKLPVTQAKNHYLEHPILHYSVGTRLSDSVIKNLKNKGVTAVTAHPDPPGFEPYMVGLRSQVFKDDDWLAKMWSSHIPKNLVQDTQRGRITNFQGSHPVPRVVDGFSLTKPINDDLTWN